MAEDKTESERQTKKKIEYGSRASREYYIVGRKGTNRRRAPYRMNNRPKNARKNGEKFIVHGQTAYWLYQAVKRTQAQNYSMRFVYAADDDEWLTALQHIVSGTILQLWLDSKWWMVQWCAAIWIWMDSPARVTCDRHQRSGRFDTRLFSIHFHRLHSQYAHELVPHSIQFCAIKPFHWQIVRWNCERNTTQNRKRRQLGVKPRAIEICISFFCFCFSKEKQTSIANRLHKWFNFIDIDAVSCRALCRKICLRPIDAPVLHVVDANNIINCAMVFHNNLSVHSRWVVVRSHAWSHARTFCPLVLMLCCCLTAPSNRSRCFYSKNDFIISKDIDLDLHRPIPCCDLRRCHWASAHKIALETELMLRYVSLIFIRSTIRM